MSSRRGRSATRAPEGTPKRTRSSSRNSRASVKIPSAIPAGTDGVRTAGKPRTFTYMTVAPTDPTTESGYQPQIHPRFAPVVNGATIPGETFRTFPEPQVYYPPEGELVFWHRIFGWILSPNQPNLISQLLQYFFVAPYTNVTNFALFYQMYLNELVHRKFWCALLTEPGVASCCNRWSVSGRCLTRVRVYVRVCAPCRTKFFHNLCSPFILAFLWCQFAQWSWGPLHLFGGLLEVDVNGPFVFLLFHTAWYSLWGVATRGVERVPLLGVRAMVGSLVGCGRSCVPGVSAHHVRVWFGAQLICLPLNLFSYGVATLWWHAWRDASATSFWYPTTHYLTTPWILMVAFTFVQALSHAFEST